MVFKSAISPQNQCCKFSDWLMLVTKYLCNFVKKNLVDSTVFESESYKVLSKSWINYLKRQLRIDVEN